MKKELVILGYLGSVGASLQKVWPLYQKYFNLKLVSLDLDPKKNMVFLKDNNWTSIFYLPHPLMGFVEQFPEKKFLTNKNQLLTYLATFKGVVINLLPGLSGYETLLASLHSNNIIITSHKEGLAYDGENIINLAQQNNCQIIPVDSEIYALRYLVKTNSKIASYLITASGGGLRDIKLNEKVTKAQVLNHPTWQMAPIITINSATMVNKLYEICEVHSYFQVPFNQIKVLINDESNVHAGVFLQDNRLLLNLGVNQMAHPIAMALDEVLAISTCPDYPYLPTKLAFREIDEKRYPLFTYGLTQIEEPNKRLVFFLSNDYFVQLFLNDKITFNQLIDKVITVSKNFPYSQLTKLSLPQKITLINNYLTNYKEV